MALELLETMMGKTLLGRIASRQEEILLLKYQLDAKISASSHIVIIGHKHPDYDSIGACTGLVTYISSLFQNKVCSIIIDDDKYNTMQKVQKVLNKDEISMPFMKNTDLDGTETDTLIIVVDANPEQHGRVPLNQPLGRYPIIVIDHHQEQEDQTPIDNLTKFIYTNFSSVSEIVTWLLTISEVEYNKTIATLLLAGIYLDTRNYNCCMPGTYIAHMILDEKKPHIEDLFELTLKEKIEVASLVACSNSENIAGINAAITFDKEPNVHNLIIYPLVADDLVKSSDIDVAGCLGFISPTEIKISIRSKGKIKASEIMTRFSGGGNDTMAAATIDCPGILSSTNKQAFLINQAQEIKNAIRESIESRTEIRGPILQKR